MLYQKLLKFFESGWFVSQNDEEQFLRLIYNGKKATWTCYAQALEEEQTFIFYSVWPELIPESKRSRVAESIARINYGLKIGNFEMDLDDGEVRYKTSILLEKDIWKTELIRPVVFYNLAMMDRYWPVLEAVANEESDPKEVLNLLK